MKPITLVSISFFDKKDNPVVDEPIMATFYDFNDMQKHIEGRRIYWTKELQKELKVEPSSVETLLAEETNTVLKHVCEFMGVDYARASSEMRDEEYIEARRFTINICYIRKMGKSSIGKGLKIEHSTVIHHIKRHKNLVETDKYYESRFIQTYEYVMEKIGGNYSEDGSGQMHVKQINNKSKDA